MFCIYKMKVKSEENHRPTQAREIEFITNAVSLTCAVFSHQCSSVSLAKALWSRVADQLSAFEFVFI